MKADSRADEMYVKDNTMYLSGTRWSNSKDVEAMMIMMIAMIVIMVILVVLMNSMLVL